MTKVALSSRFEACMILAGVGDSLGYGGGKWEFCKNGEQISSEVNQIGFANIKIGEPGFMLSDDTVMNLATAESLCEAADKPRDIFLRTIARYYKECMNDMAGRAPGNQCIIGTSQLKPDTVGGFRIPFSPRGGGCGAAMRATSIGLLYSRPEQLHKLIEVSIESGRMTHNHPTGFLGSLAAALFTSYAIQGKAVNLWGFDLMKVLEAAWSYMLKDSGYISKPNDHTTDGHDLWNYFIDAWQKYLQLRFGSFETSGALPQFPNQFGQRERDQFYTSLSHSGWGGSSGHDAPMIAYDALLGTVYHEQSKANALEPWKELCFRGVFHGGDNDSTGTLACAWYGAMYGFTDDIPKCHYENIEYKDRLINAAKKLYKMTYGEEHD